MLKSVYLWLDADPRLLAGNEEEQRIDIVRCIPFIITHLGCLGVFFVGVSSGPLLVLMASYFVRVFSLTAFYHRYFSHRAFKTSRAVQFTFAVLGATAAQRGPLWWSSHHRFHHKNSDMKEDRHSPHTQGFFWSHCGWFLLEKNFKTDNTLIKDFAKYPELIFLNRFDSLPPIIYATLLFIFGGWKYLIWGYFVSTVLVYHVTFSINSLAHMFGSRRFNTDDQSRNNWWLAILTFGEGWHNNHHFWPSSARQGFNFYQIDITYMILRLLAMLGIVWDLRTPPRDLVIV